MDSGDCPFCRLPSERIWLENEVGIAFLDGFPVSEGHALVIPRIHVASIFDLPEEARNSLFGLVGLVRDALKDEHNPDAFNIGINEGLAAGQTVPHAHIHIIPRRAGDVADPRGGVRWVIPDRADYWSK